MKGAGSLFASQLYAPLSIPSPPKSWADIYIPLGWVHDIIPAVSADYRLDIKTYALCLIAGIILAVIITSRRMTKRGAEPGVVLDIALWAVPFGIVGARVYHVLTHYNDYFGPGKNPLTAFYIWEGGIAVFGSLIGGAVGVFIGCRITGIRFWSFADALAPGIILAQAIGYEAPGEPLGAPPLFHFEPHQSEMSDFKPHVLLDITSVFDRKRRAMECLPAQQHMWDYYTDLATRRGVQLKRNAGPNLGLTSDTKGEAYMRYYPQVTTELA